MAALCEQGKNRCALLLSETPQNRDRLINEIGLNLGNKISAAAHITNCALEVIIHMFALRTADISTGESSGTSFEELVLSYV